MTGTRVTVEDAEKLSWPKQCVCCLKQVGSSTFHLKSEGHQAGVGRTATISWKVPCCPHCASHWNKGELTTKLVVVGYFIPIAIIIGMFAAVRITDHQIKIGLIFVAITAAAAIFFHLKIRSDNKRKRPLESGCSSRVPAVYNMTAPFNDPGFTVMVHRFTYSSSVYASLFAAANEPRLKIKVDTARM